MQATDRIKLGDKFILYRNVKRIDRFYDES